MGRSGPDWISYQSAAKKLGCSEAEIEHLVDSHLVRSLDEGDLRFVAGGDLEDLDQLKSPPQIDTHRLARNLSLAEQRIARLEEAVNLLYEANGFTSFKMGHLEDQTLLELTANVEQMLDQMEWPLPRLLSCAEVYLKLTEIEVERLIELTNNQNAWRPFFELCLRQLVWLSRHPELLARFEWARARDLLSQGRKNLRQLALVYCALNQDLSILFEIAQSISESEVDDLDVLVLNNRQKVPQINCS